MFSTIKKIWDGLPVFTQETIYHVHTEMRQSLDFNLCEEKWKARKKSLLFFPGDNMKMLLNLHLLI